MKYFIRIYKGIEHKVLGSESDTKICDGCNLKFGMINVRGVITKTYKIGIAPNIIPAISNPLPFLL